MKKSTQPSWEGAQQQRCLQRGHQPSALAALPARACFGGVLPNLAPTGKQGHVPDSCTAEPPRASRRRAAQPAAANPPREPGLRLCGKAAANAGSAEQRARPVRVGAAPRVPGLCKPPRAGSALPKTPRPTARRGWEQGRGSGVFQTPPVRGLRALACDPFLFLRFPPVAVCIQLQAISF